MQATWFAALGMQVSSELWFRGLRSGRDRRPGRRAGRPARADKAYLAALEAAAEADPRALGLGFDTWTSARLATYLDAQCGGRLAPGWVRALLARRRFACGRPKHTPLHRVGGADEAVGEGRAVVDGGYE
jgi:transposase